MKPAAAAFSLLLVTLLLLHTGSTMNPSQNQGSVDLSPTVKKLQEVKGEALRKEVKDLLEALLRILSKSQAQVTTATTTPVLNTIPSSPTPPPTPPPATIAKQPSTPPVPTPEPSRTATSAPSSSTAAPPAPKIPSTGAKRGNLHPQRPPTPVIKPSRTATSAPSSSTAAPPAPKIPSTGTKRGNLHPQRPPTPVIKPSRTATSAPSSSTAAPPAPKIPSTGAKRGNQHSQRPPRPVITVESSPANDKKGKGESNGPPKSDRKFLWIVLGVLGIVILVTILILKSKVLICARTHTKADVADYMEEKVYSKNEDVVLLGVTPGTEGEDDFYFSAQGCDGPMSQVTLQGYPGYEDISPRSTY